MAPQLDQIIQCPICLETLKAPILLCERGHNLCGSCVTSEITKCPTCRQPITKIRSHQMEQMIESVKDCAKVYCCFKSNGCEYKLNLQDKEKHELECKFRIFKCEAKFSNQVCDWWGKLDDMYKHFQKKHHNQCLQFKTTAVMKVDFTRDYKDIQMIPFLHGKQYFWYKHKVDVEKKMIYWAFQFIGPKKQAPYYYYEFEINRGIRKFKITESCENDTTPIDTIFANENCVTISFDKAKSFLKDGALPISFRLMNVKKNT